MSALRRIRDDLGERRALLVLLVLLVVAVAAPLLLRGGGDDTADTYQATAVATDPAGRATLAAATEALDTTTSPKPPPAGDVRDPFAMPPGAAAPTGAAGDDDPAAEGVGESAPAQAGDAAGEAIGESAPARAGDAAGEAVGESAPAQARGAPGAGATAPPPARETPAPNASQSPPTAAPDAGSGDGDASPTGATDGSSGAPVRKPVAYRLHHVDVRFDGLPTRAVVRLRPFPSARTPIAIYLGLTRRGLAAFALAPGVQPGGVGACRPRRSLCSDLLLAPGERATLTFGDARHALRVVRVRRETTTDRAHAIRVRSRASERGRCLMDLRGYVAYDLATGTVKPHHDARTCRYVTDEATGMVGVR